MPSPCSFKVPKLPHLLLRGVSTGPMGWGPSPIALSSSVGRDSGRLGEAWRDPAKRRGLAEGTHKRGASRGRRGPAQKDHRFASWLPAGRLGVSL